MILKSMLKQALVPAIALFAGITAQAQNKFNINGQLGKNIQGKIFIQYNKHPGAFVEDSTMVVNGSFHFNGDIGDPYFSSLLFIKAGSSSKAVTQSSYKQFFLEGTTITVASTDSLGAAIVTGGKTQADHLQRSALLDDLSKQYRPLAEQLSRLHAAGDMEGMKAIQKQIAPIMAKQAQIDSAWIKSHLDSYAAFILWSKKQKGDLKPEDIATYNSFTARIHNTEQGVIFGDKIKLQQKLSPGNLAPDVSAKDTLGKMVALSSLRGKYVMLLFYEKGNIIEQMFNQFTFNMRKVTKRLKDKNFVVLGVNYDDTEKWHQTIQATTNNWIHVTDAGGITDKGAVSQIAKTYGLTFRTTPQAFLIGPDGKIIMRKIKLLDNELSLELEKIVK